jgi:hypothetical protein
MGVATRAQPRASAANKHVRNKLSSARLSVVECRLASSNFSAFALTLEIARRTLDRWISLQAI